MDHVTGLATEKAEAFVHASLSLLRRKLAIATELVGQVVLLRHRQIGRLARILLRCRRGVRGAAGCRTGGRGLSTPVVVRGRGGRRGFRLVGFVLGLDRSTGFTSYLASAFPVSLIKT